MLNGATQYLPSDVIMEAGVLFAAAIAKGVTKGAPKWSPGKTITPITFDGQKSDIQTLDRITRWKPVITATLIEFGGSTTGNQLGFLEPGSTSATHALGTITRIQPRVAGAMFASGEYITDLRLMFERANGGYAAIYMPIALCVKYDVAGVNAAEALVACEFEARLSVSDLISTPGKCPYSIELRTSLPS